MKDLQQTLLSLILNVTNQGKGKRQIVYLEGGYYDTRFGPQKFSINTLSASIKTAEEIVKKKYKVTRVILGVLVNNIGIICGQDSCTISHQGDESKNDMSPVMPSVLNNMLKKSKVTKNDEVIFTNEKTLRNRGLRLVKKIIDETEKYSVIMDKNKNNEILYSVMINDDKIPLTIKKGETWAARCPLIMGQHYADLYINIGKKYGSNTSILLVDMGEMYDRHKMNNGAKVALMLLEKMYGYDVSNLKIVNFSFQDDELINFESDLAEKHI